MLSVGPFTPQASRRVSCWGSLPMEVSLNTAAELRLQWLVELDGSAVEQFDAADAQSLLVLAHALSARGQRLRLTRASDVLVHACRALGLADLIASTAHEQG
ncbi:hypothetical protein [Roseateles sp. P5_E11]